MVSRHFLVTTDGKRRMVHNAGSPRNPRLPALLSVATRMESEFGEIPSRDTATTADGCQHAGPSTYTVSSDKRSACPITEQSDVTCHIHCIMLNAGFLEVARIAWRWTGAMEG